MHRDKIEQPEWIHEILSPLSDVPIGIDPKYEEDFGCIKREVEKLCDIDFEKVQTLSIRLLKEKTKDLRVLGYLLLSCSYLNDIDTVINVLVVYDKLINLYWQSIHPQRASSRMAAIDWLNNERLTRFITLKLSDADKTNSHMLLECINKLNASLIAQAGNLVSQYVSLHKVLKEQTVMLIEVSNALTEPKKPEVEIALEQKITIIPSAPVGPLQSRDAVDVATRNIIQFFNNNGQKLYAAAFARALKWSALNPAAETDNKTVFAPPCDADKKELKWALETEDPKELYRVCEKQFFNMGGHVNFDLQYYAHQAAIDMGEESLAQYLEWELKGLIARVPSLMTLLYKDGTTFMSDITRAWLTSKHESHKTAKKITEEPNKGQSQEWSLIPENIRQTLMSLPTSDQEGFERKLAKSILFLTATMM